MLIEVNGDLSKLPYRETMSLVDTGSLKISADRRVALTAVLTGIRLSNLGFVAVGLAFLFTNLAVLLALFGHWQLAIISYVFVLCSLWLLRNECANSVVLTAMQNEMAFLQLRQEGFVSVVPNSRARS